MPLEILLLRLVHVLGGIFWAGGGIYGALFVTPALIAAGPAAAPIIADMQRRKLFTVLPVVAILTMLSGLRLLWIVSGGFGAAYFGTRQGLTYALAGGASIVAFLVALTVARPAGVRLGQLAATRGARIGGGHLAARVRRTWHVRGTLPVAPRLSLRPACDRLEGTRE